uniref:Uncharacterized protein n=1 Tax=Moschus moschiferus TaxID=68415 RepID=A0A8C6CG66_MOSMO
MSKKGKKRTWIDINPTRELPVMGKTRLMISNHSELAPRTNWGQLKKLTTEGEKLVKEQGQPLTLATLFLAMLPVVTTTSGSTSPRKSTDNNSN